MISVDSLITALGRHLDVVNVKAGTKQLCEVSRFTSGADGFVLHQRARPPKIRVQFWVRPATALSNVGFVISQPLTNKSLSIGPPVSKQPYINWFESGHYIVTGTASAPYSGVAAFEMTVDPTRPGSDASVEVL